MILPLYACENAILDASIKIFTKDNLNNYLQKTIMIYKGQYKLVVDNINKHHI